MPFTLIRGQFHVAGYSPDGDSIRFKPDNLELLEQLDNFPAQVNGRGHVQLRIEAIDTLETHYSTSAGTLHQPLDTALEAANALLDFTRITNVVWNSNRTNIVSASDGTSGYILSRAVEKYGRPIAFVFAGIPEQDDGDGIILDVAGMRDSYNRLALAEGLAYPTFYNGLFHDLRDDLTSAARAARQANKGIYKIDATHTGVDASSLADLTEGSAVLPKLFRRLVDYITETGTVDGFKDAMELSREPVFDLRTQNFTHFDSFIDQQDATVLLMRLPEELVFDEMPERPIDAFAAMVAEENQPVL